MPAYTNPGPLRFDAPILRGRDAPNSSSFVEFPYSVSDLFGVKGRVPVRASFDGLPYSGSLVKMGEGRHLLLLLKKIREQLGKQPGDTVAVAIELDDAPRAIESPDDLAAALAANPDADRGWQPLAYTHRKEYVRWIEEAKRPETRAQRVVKSIEMLTQGVKALR